MERSAPLAGRTVSFRKRFMWREEVRAAAISSTASCREEEGGRGSERTERPEPSLVPPGPELTHLGLLEPAAEQPPSEPDRTEPPSCSQNRVQNPSAASDRDSEETPILVQLHFTAAGVRGRQRINTSGPSGSHWFCGSKTVEEKKQRFKLI